MNLIEQKASDSVRLEEFLKRQGLVEMSFEQKRNLKTDVVRQVYSGLAGQPETVMMYPAGLRELGETELVGGAKVVVADAGGSGLKCGVYEVVNGELKLTGELRETKFPKKKWRARKFFDFIAKELMELGVDWEEIAGVALIFSYPSEAVETDTGVDVKAKDKLTKDWVARGMSKKPVGRQLAEALVRQRASEKIYQLPWLTMNDTVAVLYSEEGAVMSAVVATGFNIAVIIGGKVYNSEAGGYGSEFLPLNDLVLEFDRTTTNKGQYMAEKMIAGAGVGGQMREFIRLSRKEGLLPRVPKVKSSEFYTKVVSLILEGDWNEVEKRMGQRLDDEARELLKRAANTIIQNSVDVLACLTVAFAEVANVKRVVLPMEGTFSSKTPGYKERFKEAVREFNSEIEFEVGREKARPGMEGGARAVMGEVGKVREG